MECGIVSPQDASVLVGAHCVLLLDRPKVPVVYYGHSQHIGCSWNDLVSDIEFCPCKGPVYPSNTFPVQEYNSYPVDPVKMQEQLILLEILGNEKFGPVPEVFTEKRFGDLQLVVTIVRIRKGPHVQVA